MTDPAIITVYDVARARAADAYSQDATEEMMRMVKSILCGPIRIDSPDEFWGAFDGLVDVLIARGVGL